jgi:hypothetical protein
MGIDVNLYAEGVVTDEEMVAAEAVMVERFGKPETGDAWLERVTSGMDHDFENRIEFQCLNRYYGPGYERGYWPVIYGMIRAMQAAFPRCTVYYGGDASDDGDEVTDASMAAIWNHWTGPNWDDYHLDMRSWAAKL